MNTEQILSHIREVCGLKRLEFGCEVKIGHGTYQTSSPNDNIGDRTCLFVKNIINGIELQSKDDKCTYVKLNRNECELEIIGLPVHLEHLLYVISKRGGRAGTISIPTINNEVYDIEEYFVDTMVAKLLCIYDLTRTVEQNLNDNAELRELIISLIK